MFMGARSRSAGAEAGSIGSDRSLCWDAEECVLRPAASEKACSTACGTDDSRQHPPRGAERSPSPRRRFGVPLSSES